MRIFGKNGDEILSVDDWFAKAPPKQGILHWKDYRSAKELAKSWFRTPNATPPEEMLLFLRRLFPACEVILTDAYPECIVTLDDFGGGQKECRPRRLGHCRTTGTGDQHRGKGG